MRGRTQWYLQNYVFSGHYGCQTLSLNLLMRIPLWMLMMSRASSHSRHTLDTSPKCHQITQWRMNHCFLQTHKCNSAAAAGDWAACSCSHHGPSVATHHYCLFKCHSKDVYSGWWLRDRADDMGLVNGQWSAATGRRCTMGVQRDTQVRSSAGNTSVTCSRCLSGGQQRLTQAREIRYKPGLPLLPRYKYTSNAPVKKSYIVAIMDFL